MLPSSVKSAFILLLLSTCAWAQWFQTYEDTFGGNIVRMDKPFTSLAPLYGAGPNGYTYVSGNNGHNWQINPTPTTETLNDIAAFDNDGFLVLVAAGNNGMLLRSTDNGNSWQQITPFTTGNLLSIHFDTITFRLWVGSNLNELFYSDDAGLSWTPFVAGTTGLEFVDLQTDYDGLVFAAIRNDTSFVQRIVPQGTTPLLPSPGDTLADFKISRLHYDGYNQVYYYSGNKPSSGEGIIGQRSTNQATLLPPVDIFQGNVGTITSVAYFDQQLGQSLTGTSNGQAATTSDSWVWFTTDQGELWASPDKGASWQVKFRDSQGRPLNDVVSNTYVPDFATGLGVAAGNELLSLLNNFELQYTLPGRNDLLNSPNNRVELKFSVIPDIFTVQDSVTISSSLSGNIPYSAYYDATDSSRLFLDIYRSNLAESVPGENWQITLPRTLRSKYPDINVLFRDESVDAFFTPYTSGRFRFKAVNSAPDITSPSTNVVAGWFNDDDIFDLVTYRNDSLIVFQMSDSGTVSGQDAFYMGLGINIDTLMTGQLLITDANLDGKPDLLVYDSDRVYTIENQSGAAFYFVPGIVQHATVNIRQVSLINYNQNRRPDLLILNDSLTVREDFSITQQGSPPITLETATLKQQIALGDIDDNGLQDMVALNANGDLVFQRQMDGGGFDQETVVANNLSFRFIRLADLNLDKFPEIITADDYSIYIYQNDPQSGTFIPIAQGPLAQASADIIEDVLIREFGIENQPYYDTRFQDLAVLTRAGTLKFFENNGDMSFSEVTSAQQNLSNPQRHLIHFDTDRNGQLDILAANNANSRMEVVLNENWAPSITLLTTEPGGVRLNWTPLPADQGTLDFYRVYRDSTGADFTQPDSFDFFNVNDTSFLDRGTRRFRNYWYGVKAVYNGTEQSRSQIREIRLIKTLSGALSGVLSDTVNGMAVYDSIIVPAGQQLEIQQGVEFAFDSLAYFSVYGGLRVSGTEDQMVDFHELWNDRGPVTWDGIRLNPAADTVYFNWFSINAAQTALKTQGRPLKMKLGGFSRNQTALITEQDTLVLENVVFDSNMVAAQFGYQSKSLLKNINVLYSQTEGLTFTAGARGQIRNAIVWYNKYEGINAVAGSSVKVSYSTVDSVIGFPSLYEISRQAPLFLPPDSGYYQPDPLSPTVDAGDPDDDFSPEPLPNGGRINQGLFGGTYMATRSLRPKIVTTLDTVFTAAHPGEKDSTRFFIRNDGARDLLINFTSVLKRPDLFAILQDTQNNLAPGDSVPMTVIFSPDTRDSLGDSLLIDSNDPAEPQKYIPLFGRGLNWPPELTNEPPSTARTGTLYSYGPAYLDRDADSVSMEVTRIPRWMSLTTQNILQGTPQLADTGYNELRLRLTDSYGDTTAYLFGIDVFHENQPPQWSGADTLQLWEDASRLVDLSLYIDDDVTPPGKIIFELTGNSNPENIQAEIQDSLLTIRPAENYFNTTPDTLYLLATDEDTSSTPRTLLLSVQGVDDPPLIGLFADTTIFTNIYYDVTFPAEEVDGQPLSFSDNSPLFTIEPDSGHIRFTPLLADTGSYLTVISVSDGISTVRDTFTLTIEPNFINPVEELSVESADRALKLTFTLPVNDFYSGTLIRYSATDTVLAPNEGQAGADTTFTAAAGSRVTVTLDSLDINQQYYISVFNYLDQNGVIYSPRVSITGRTTAPDIRLGQSTIKITLPVDQTRHDSLWVYNDGAGSLIFRYAYLPDSLLDVWFDADTAVYTVPPMDSLAVTFNLHPNKYLPRGDKQALLRAESNSPGQDNRFTRIVFSPIFDDFAPRVTVKARSDSLVRESSIQVIYSADDLTDRPIGYVEDSLLYSYRLWKLPDTTLMASGDGTREHALNFYPLADGPYVLKLWAYDPEDNGRAGKSARWLPFYIKATERFVLRNRWYLVSLPQTRNVRWQNFVTDSLVQMYRWNDEKGRYDTYSSFADSSLPYGQAAWLITDKNFPLALEQEERDSSVLLSTPVQKGWNQLGIPLTYSTYWKDMRLETSSGVYTMARAAQDSLIEPAVYWYVHNKDLQGYEWATLDEAIAQPWRGYWFYSREEGTLLFDTSAASLLKDTTLTVADSSSLEKSGAPPLFNIAVSGNDFQDSRNEFGFTNGRRVNITEPPQIGNGNRFYFSKDGRQFSRALQTTGGGEGLNRWQAHIVTRQKQKVTLSWDSREMAQSEYYLYLVDNRGQTIINMKEQDHYMVEMAGNYALSIEATTDAGYKPQLLPASFVLQQNYPNPFNPETTIRFGLPEDIKKQVDISVYNVLGQKVTTLFKGALKAGYHEMKWNGRNRAGKPVASGIYFLKVAAGKYSGVRKMILMK